MFSAVQLHRSNQTILYYKGRLKVIQQKPAHTLYCSVRYIVLCMIQQLQRIGKTCPQVSSFLTRQLKQVFLQEDYFRFSSCKKGRNLDKSKDRLQRRVWDLGLANWIRVADLWHRKGKMSGCFKNNTFIVLQNMSNSRKSLRFI